MLKPLTILSLLLWCILDPLRDLWFPCIPPDGGSHWFDLYHNIKHLSHYPMQACLLWWMWPLRWKERWGEHVYWSTMGIDGDEVIKERIVWSLRHAIYWAASIMVGWSTY